RQSVRAITRTPDALAACTAARIFMRASSRGRQGLPAAVSARGVILSSISTAPAPARPYAATVRCTFIALPWPWSPSARTIRSGAAPRTMLNESIISPNETRSRSGPPSRLAATQEPDRNAVLKPASWVSLAVRPSHTAGITTRPGWARTFRSCSGALVISLPPLDRLVRAGAPALHHLVAGPAVVDDLARRLDTGGRQTLRIEQADLHQHRCLIPVDVLMRDLVSDESHDGDQRNLDLPAGRRNAGQQPVDLAGV